MLTSPLLVYRVTGELIPPPIMHLAVEWSCWTRLRTLPRATSHEPPHTVGGRAHSDVCRFHREACHSGWRQEAPRQSRNRRSGAAAASRRGRSVCPFWIAHDRHFDGP